MTRPESASPQSSLVPQRKAVLFCPTCEHVSPYDGDWDVSETGEAITYHCPTCHELIQRRSVSTTPTAATPSTPQFGVSPETIENWTRVWSSWTTAWVRFVTQT
jgi:hypothetical protein